MFSYILAVSAFIYSCFCIILPMFSWFFVSYILYVYYSTHVLCCTVIPAISNVLLYPAFALPCTLLSYLIHILKLVLCLSGVLHIANIRLLSSFRYSVFLVFCTFFWFYLRE